jgi:hypothetical protein
MERALGLAIPSSEASPTLVKGDDTFFLGDELLYYDSALLSFCKPFNMAVK